jgi:hypothetical protein
MAPMWGADMITRFFLFDFFAVQESRSWPDSDLPQCAHFVRYRVVQSGPKNLAEAARATRRERFRRTVLPGGFAPNVLRQTN